MRGIFRWPGGAILALAVATITLIAAAQSAIVFLTGGREHMVVNDQASTPPGEAGTSEPA